MAKSDPYRFNLRFDATDELQSAAADRLNSLPAKSRAKVVAGCLSKPENAMPANDDLAEKIAVLVCEKIKKQGVETKPRTQRKRKKTEPLPKTVSHTEIKTPRFQSSVTARAPNETNDMHELEGSQDMLQAAQGFFV